ncbi:hypothetical protein [Enhygromyxa salina]|uniref:Lipoprotein n=1 Tax=Enhygromyxa salina TaxID=215803 RepID=A0A2S9YBX7_9BACT|nr:hypothetical protein [Enhygromyxa salina]PRQ02628.1 hypothetical protein ENSA7_54570 [Enhygromyxa salina]
MMARRSPVRPLITVALALGLAVFGSACDGDKTNEPGGAGGAQADGGGSGKAAEGGKDYVYDANGFTLIATTKTKMELSSTQGKGESELSVRSVIEATPQGEGLEVHGRVLELLDYKGSGQLDPEFMRKQAEEAGEEPMDLRAELAKSESWSIIDLKGEADEKATKAMAENQGEDDGPMNFGLFGLPDLPTVDLEVGNKVELPTKADERELPFGSVPVEVDVTWTLRGVEGDVAEFDVTVEGSGATEIDAGGATAMVSILEESSYTVFFNLASKLPVSYNGYSQSEINIDIPGQPISFATNNEIETTYEVSTGPVPEPAPAPEAAPVAAPES